MWSCTWFAFQTSKYDFREEVLYLVLCYYMGTPLFSGSRSNPWNYCHCHWERHPGCSRAIFLVTQDNLSSQVLHCSGSLLYWSVQFLLWVSQSLKNVQKRSRWQKEDTVTVCGIYVAFYTWFQGQIKRVGSASLKRNGLKKSLCKSKILSTLSSNNALNLWLKTIFIYTYHQTIVRLKCLQYLNRFKRNTDHIVNVSTGR